MCTLFTVKRNSRCVCVGVLPLEKLQSSRSHRKKGEVMNEEMNAKLLQSCRALCDPMDYSLTGSSVHGILQATMLEWVAISCSRGLPNPGIEPGSLALQADSLRTEL